MWGMPQTQDLPLWKGYCMDCMDHSSRHSEFYEELAALNFDSLGYFHEAIYVDVC